VACRNPRISVDPGRAPKTTVSLLYRQRYCLQTIRAGVSITPFDVDAVVKLLGGVPVVLFCNPWDTPDNPLDV